jgi:uncharacterized protein YaiL (DUF2058 family)
MNSLRDQLFKAGLVTAEQVKKSAEKPKRHQQNKKVNKPPQPKAAKPHKPKKERSELELFYRQRSNAENKERQLAKKAKEEAAQRKKERNIKISQLVNENKLNVDDASERYNFVVGTAVKYLYVNAQQLDQLADGILALTFLKGKCCIISIDTAEEIKKIDDKRLVIQQKPEATKVINKASK